MVTPLSLKVPTQTSWFPYEDLPLIHFKSFRNIYLSFDTSKIDLVTRALYRLNGNLKSQQDFMKLILSFFVLLSATPLLFAKDIEMRDCPKGGNPVKKCKQAYFHTDKGSRVAAEIFLSDYSSPGDEFMVSHLSIWLTYVDSQFYFGRAQSLYPYVGIKISRIHKDGRVESIPHHFEKAMGRGRSDSPDYLFYQLDFVNVLKSKADDYYDRVDQVNVAFTNESPHSGTAKWDSDYHRNYNYKVDLVQAWKPEDEKPQCSTFKSREACHAAGCSWDYELGYCL